MNKGWLSLFLCMVMATSSNGQTIHQAAGAGNIAKVKELLVREPGCISYVNADGETPLHIAAFRGELAVVNLLLSHGPDINARAYNRFTALHVARDRTIFGALLAHKPDLAAEDISLRTPLIVAAENFSLFSGMPNHKDEAAMWLEIVNMLRAAGSRYDIRTAVYLKDVAGARSLLKPGSSNNSQRRLGLRLAAREDCPKIVKLLLEAGTDPNDVEEGCGLPLLADGIEHAAVVKTLLDNGAKATVRVNFTCCAGGAYYVGGNATLLHFAAQAKAVESARMLLQRGVKVNDTDDKGQTALHVAAAVGSAVMTRFLLDNGADGNMRDKRGLIPSQVPKSPLPGTFTDGQRE